jgi:hypothetical protein
MKQWSGVFPATTTQFTRDERAVVLERLAPSVPKAAAHIA